MSVKIYAVKDVAAGRFFSPIFVQNDQLLKRGVKEAVNSGEKNMFSEFVEDKAVYCLGEYDQETGVIRPCDPVLVFNCVDLKEAKA